MGNDDLLPGLILNSLSMRTVLAEVNFSLGGHEAAVSKTKRRGIPAPPPLPNSLHE